MRVGTMRRASLLTVGQRVGCSGAYSARLDPQTERAQVERGLAMYHLYGYAHAAIRVCIQAHLAS
jgi:hypothetical protein